ncbi:MAG: hypothetical protein ACE5L6_06775 [Candidatus Bathyarchaeia archaeon]
MNAAGILGTASAGIQTSSSIFTTGVDSWQSVENVGVRSLTDKSSGEGVTTDHEDLKTALAYALQR